MLARRAWFAAIGAAILAVALATLLTVAPARRAAWLGLKQGGHAMGLNWARLRALRHAAPLLATIAPLGGAAAANAPGPVPPTQLAVNLSPPVWWDDERSFANLAIGMTWQKQTSGGWVDGAPSEVGPDGAILTIPPEGFLQRILTAPVTGPEGATIRCRFAGEGRIEVGGRAENAVTGAHEIQFHWINRWEPSQAWLRTTAVGAGGIGPVDCRETDMSPNALYDPAFVRSIRPYRVLRFKDWQQIDANAPVRWADRHRPGGIQYIVEDGVPIEDMVALARESGADPWFCMPWNADAAYVAGFARVVHGLLPPGRKVYVELGNEVWNWGYPVTHQSMREGQAAKLSADGGDAVLLRYAQKTVEVMRVWEKAFADRPRDLVRVVAAQHVAPRSAELILGFPGLAGHVDALATAPYFGFGLKPESGDASLDRFFDAAHASIDTTIAQAVTMKAIAHRYGKRYIAYEAGQHIQIADIPLQRRIQRDQRMYELYKHYLTAWTAHVGDVLALFHTTSPIDASGAWGLVEHSGQPLSETPKLRAVLEAEAR